MQEERGKADYADYLGHLVGSGWQPACGSIVVSHFLNYQKPHWESWSAGQLVVSELQTL